MIAILMVRFPLLLTHFCFLLDRLRAEESSLGDFFASSCLFVPDRTSDRPLFLRQNCLEVPERARGERQGRTEENSKLHALRRLQGGQDVASLHSNLLLPTLLDDHCPHSHARLIVSSSHEPDPQRDVHDLLHGLGPPVPLHLCEQTGAGQRDICACRSLSPLCLHAMGLGT